MKAKSIGLNGHPPTVGNGQALIGYGLGAAFSLAALPLLALRSHND